MSDNSNRRSDERLGVQLPVRVQGFDPTGARWEEMTTGEDISSGGAAFIVKHTVAKGQALVLSLPLPKRYRTFDLTTPSYRVFALVRKVEAAEGGFRIGLMFIGKTPPKGFEENPAIRYLLPGEAPPERRGEGRFQVFLNFKLRSEPIGQPPTEEQTVAENLSKGGARVLTTLPVAKGDILWLEEIGGVFRTRAEVKNAFLGSDNVRRLSLRFLDGKVPDRLIAS
jgi:hypothetical protein